jgi:glucuronate isomerase
VFEMARMATEDGLTMTLHPGVRCNHHRPTFATFGGAGGRPDLAATGVLDDAARRVLASLDGALADDAAVLVAVTDHPRGLGTR